MNYFRCTVGGSGKGNTVTVTCAEEFAGLTITLSKTGKTYTKTCPSTSPYTVTFYGVENGTYTVSTEYNGQTYSETVVVQDISCVLNYGFTWRTWVDTASQLDSSDYASLSEVLADEEALRELFLEHACVDYMASVGVNEDLETVINNDYCAKWINLSDYALDFLHANEVIADLMDEADKYGYGEWALLPQVPTMTSNTAPYGEASKSSSETSYPAYKAFDGDDTTFASLHYGTSNGSHSITYKFVQPTCVKKFRYYQTTSSNITYFDISVKLQGSNDGSTWDDIATNTINLGVKNDNYFEVSNDDYYLYYKLYFPSALARNSDNNYFTYPRTIQFYAWAPKGNIPIMTSDSAPYGSAFSSGASSGFEAYKAFDGDITTRFVSSTTTSNTGHVGYKFANPIMPKGCSLIIWNQSGATATISGVIEGSNDGTNYDSIGTFQATLAHSTYGEATVTISTSNYYLYLRARRTVGTDRFGVNTLQFYGRELKVSVPTMTSNTAPIGTAVSSIANSGYEAFKAFDNSDTTYFCPPSNTTAEGTYIGYVFPAPMKLQQISYRCTGGSGTITMAKVQYSDDGGTTWNDQTTSFNYSIDDTYHVVNIENASPHKAWRVYKISASTANSFAHKTLQFYGEDYSEKEFEVGTTKKWLYDHGLELVDFETTKGSATTSAVPYNDGNEIYIPTLAGSASTTGTFSGIGLTIDLTNYIAVRATVGARIKSAGSSVVSCMEISAWPSKPTGDYISSARITAKDATVPMSDKTLYLNISTVNNSVFLGAFAMYYTGRESSIEELWLE